MTFKAAFAIRDVDPFHDGLMTANTVFLDDLPAPFRGMKNVGRIKGVFVDIPCPGIPFINECNRDTILRDMTVPAIDLIFFPVDSVKGCFIGRFHDMARRSAVLIGGRMFIFIGNKNNEKSQKREAYEQYLFVFTW